MHGNTTSIGGSTATTTAGLSASYYTDDGSHTFPTNPTDPTRLLFTRTDANINFDWQLGGPNPANTSANADNFLVRWTGNFVAPSAGTYTFGTTNVDDGSRVIVNGTTVVNDFNLNAAHDTWAASSITLTAGQVVPIQVEFREGGEDASMQLSYKLNGGTAQVVPGSALQNTTAGTTAATTNFVYDSSDRNIGISEGSKSTTYARDVQGRITQRVTTGTGSGTAATWTSADVGAPAIAGSDSYNSSTGTYTVNGAGTDVWDNGGATPDDQFHFKYQQMTGDGTIIARVKSQTNTDDWAKAGIVIKASTTSGSNYASIHTTPANGIRMQYGYTNDLSGGSYTFPNAWLKLTRTGNTITTYKSTNGTTWTQVGTTTVTLPSTALIGLYVNSVNSGTLGTATFDNVSITPVTSPPSTATDYYGYTASGDTPDFLTDSSNNITEKYLTLPGDVLVTIRPSKTTPADKTYSLPDIHGDIFATTNATGTLLTTGQTGPFGEQLSGQTTPTNTATNATFGYVGQHEKITEASFTLTPVQMGARVYIPGLGRFLSVDPQQGGTANAYVYALDPVNDFDLDGTFSLKNALSVATKIATVGSFIPGPVGMACSGVAAAGYIAQGQYANAAMAAVAFIPGGKIASSLASKSSFGTKMLTAVVRTQSKAPGIGVKGGLFGTKALSAKSGLLNRNNPVLKIGWHRDSGKTVFRLGVGQKTYYNFNRAKNVKVSRWHVNIGRF